MKIFSFLPLGTEVQPIEVQVHTRFQIPSFHILGLAGPEILEARERIIAAFSASKLDFPKKKVIVNLSPSDVKKSGTGHDLAMAVSILQTQEVESLKQDRIYAWGALGLDGKIQPCGKIASLIDLLCRDPSPKTIFLSPEDARDFQEIAEWRKAKNLPPPEALQVRVVHSLHEVVNAPKERKIPPFRTKSPPLPALLPLLSHQQRILDLSIVGRHHTLILGPKGVGKSQMLEWYRWLSPESDSEKIWQRMLYEDTAKNGGGLSHSLPWRSVHSQIKPAHLLGNWGPKGFRAGELSLAHGGILVADEFLEWHRDAKECLREPLQNKQTTVTRVHGTAAIDCDFQLLATGNLCPCGGLPARFRETKSSQRCQCHPSKVEEYLQRLSGPIADRIDIIGVFHQEMDSSSSDFAAPVSMEDVSVRKSSLLRRREFALMEFGALPSELSVHWLEKNLPAGTGFQKMLADRTTSLRSRHKALRVARTIQAVELSREFKPEYLFEATTFRFMEQ